MNIMQALSLFARLMFFRKNPRKIGKRAQLCLFSPGHFSKSFWSFMLALMILSANLTSNAQALPPYSIKGFYQGIILIKGRTNINSFQLKANITEQPIEYDQQSKSYFLRIPVEKFKAANPMMEKDFRNLMEAHKYPDIIIQFKELNPSDLTGNGEAPIYLKIREKTVKMQIGFSTNEAQANHIVLSGEKPLKLSEVDIIPPDKIFGLITIKDELRINFAIEISHIKVNESANAF
jgi:hypothetical protein